MIAPESGIVVLTGAGISRESGLATFRDPGGIWSQVRIEDVATPGAFTRDAARVHAFYNERRRQLANPGVEPNAAHLALAELERTWSGSFLLVTQNVDDLHERAASERLVHMHGSLRNARCNHCHAGGAWSGDLSAAVACPVCGTAGAMRPDVVWFGEMPREMDRIETALSRCGLFVSIGTSGAVYPAAGFVAQVRGRAHTVELNLDRSEGADQFDEGQYGPATKIVPAFVNRLRSSASL